MDFDRLTSSQGLSRHGDQPAPISKPPYPSKVENDHGEYIVHFAPTSPSPELAFITFHSGTFTIDTSSWNRPFSCSSPKPIKRLTSKIDIVIGPAGTLTIAHQPHASLAHPPRPLEYEQWCAIRSMIPELHPDKAIGCTEDESKWPILALGRRVLEHSLAQPSRLSTSTSTSTSTDQDLGSDVLSLLTTLGIFRMPLSDGDSYGNDLSDIVVPIRQYQSSEGGFSYTEIPYPPQQLSQEPSAHDDDDDDNDHDSCLITLHPASFTLSHCSWRTIPAPPLRITRDSTIDITPSPETNKVSILLRRHRRPGTPPRRLTLCELASLQQLATQLVPDRADNAEDEEEEYWPSEALARRALEHLEAVDLLTRKGRGEVHGEGEGEGEGQVVRDVGSALDGLIEKLGDRDCSGSGSAGSKQSSGAQSSAFSSAFSLLWEGHVLGPVAATQARTKDGGWVRWLRGRSSMGWLLRKA